MKSTGTTTNFVHITNVDKFRKVLTKLVSCNGGVHAEVKEAKDINGNTVYGFYVPESIFGMAVGVPDDVDLTKMTRTEIDEKYEVSYTALFDAFCSVIADDDALILTGVSVLDAEKTISGWLSIVTRKEFKHISLDGVAEKYARKMLKNKNWQVQTSEEPNFFTATQELHVVTDNVRFPAR